jgi:hypothetical protein
MYSKHRQEIENHQLGAARKFPCHSEIGDQEEEPCRQREQTAIENPHLFEGEGGVNPFGEEREQRAATGRRGDPDEAEQDVGSGECQASSRTRL